MNWTQSLQQLELPSWQWAGGGGAIAIICLLWGGGVLLKKAPGWGIATAVGTAKVLIGKPILFALLAGTVFAGLGMFRQSALGNAAVARLAMADNMVTGTLLQGGVKAESVFPVKAGGVIGILSALAVLLWQMKEDARQTLANVIASRKTGIVGVVASISAVLALWAGAKTGTQYFTGWSWPQAAAYVYGALVLGVLSCFQAQTDVRERLNFQSFLREYGSLLAVCVGFIPAAWLGTCQVLESTYPAEFATTKAGYEVIAGIVAAVAEGAMIGYRVKSDNAKSRTAASTTRRPIVADRRYA